MNVSAAHGAGFDACRAAIQHYGRPYRLSSPDAQAFRGSFRNFSAAGLNLTRLHLGRSCLSQDEGAIAAGGPRYYSLVIQVGGTAQVRGAHGATVLHPGDLMLVDSHRPIAVEVTAMMQQIALNILDPEDVARLDRIAPPPGECIGRARGPAALLTDTLLSVARNADALRDIDLRAQALALLLSTLGKVPKPRPLAAGKSTKFPDAPHGAARAPEADVAGITRFIDAHLAEALDPQRIAAHFGLSRRQLYRVIAPAGLTPAALLWQRRLHRARQELRDAPDATITEIAMRCGFKDSGHFARAYRRVFGESPGESRRGPTARRGPAA
jgi:AraC family transcriptional regulator, positive regulator of tynA and feaB